MKKTVPILTILALLALVSSCDLLSGLFDSALGTPLNTDITTDQTLATGRYVVSGIITVSATLTINDDTVLLMKSGSGFRVVAGGSIVAVSSGGLTEQTRIVISAMDTGTTKGLWEGISFEAGTGTLTNAIIRNADTAITVAGVAEVALNSCVIENSNIGVDWSGISTGTCSGINTVTFNSCTISDQGPE